MTALELIAAPSGLGLLPAGVERAPAALLGAGVERRLGARLVGTVEPPPAAAMVDAATGLLRPAELAVMAGHLADAIGRVLDAGATPVVLGGDCSILFGSMLALRRRGHFGLLYLDGHADFCDPREDDLGEAASVDLAVATGRGPAVVADLEGLGPLVRDEDVAVLAHRSAENDAHLGLDVRDTAITVRDLRNVRRDGIETCTARALEAVTGAHLDGFWLHFDVDVLDDALMPAVDYREPGGLDWDEAAHVLHAAAASGRMTGLQVTIYNPTLDEPGAPLAARIVDVLGRGLAALA